ATYGARFSRRWSNEFEAGLTASRELETGSRVERGMSLREELRLSGDGWSATGFFNYRSNTPTLAGLIVRNPLLLPPALRSAYETDPARFLAENRDALPSLLGGVALPATRDAVLGLRLQAALARYRFIAESRYDSGEAFARERRGAATSLGAVVRLDGANSVRVSAERSFAFDGGQSRTALTLSLIHRFGVPGGGLGLAKLFRFDEGKIEGRAFFDLNADGSDDPGEPGVGGLMVRLDGVRSAMTDARGRYSFSSVTPGEHTVALVSDRLGVSLRASSPAERAITVGARRTAVVGFGLSDFGSIGGHVFNDLYLTGAADSQGAPGLRGLRVLLRGASVASLTTDASGLYEFRNLAPGSYTLEIDPASLPADFRPPARLSWPVNLSPLQDFFMDIPVAAQRAVSGVVFLDRDGDGRFDPARDLPLAGARVAAHNAETVTDANGAYLLRGLPAGHVTLRVTLRDGRSRETILDLSPDPTFMRGQDVGFTP
ncbi:MAG TPA: SdrD B-like domain-containing protein, partial [Pyrinomonadaceae bacterium]|nr:SdrD B-like domain-containing protein [Pyrinomonadaceae bacterium]